MSALKDQEQDDTQLNPGDRDYQEKIDQRFERMVNQIPVDQEFDDIVNNYNEDPNQPKQDTTRTKKEMQKREGASVRPFSKRVNTSAASNLAKYETPGPWTSDVKKKQPSGSSGNIFQRSLQRIRGMSSRQRWGLAVGGTAGGGIISILFMMSMSPFSVPGNLDLFNNKRSEKNQRYNSAASKQVFYEGASSNWGEQGGDTKYKPNSPLGKQFQLWRDNNFEQRLKDNHGIEFTNTGDGGRRVTLKGQDLGVARNPSEMKGLFDRAGPTAQAAVEQVVRLEMKSGAWGARLKGNWWKPKFGIPRYGTEKHNDADPEERKKKTRESFLRAQFDKALQLLDDGMECLFRPTNCSLADAPSSSESVDDDKANNAKESTNESLNETAEQVIADEAEGKNTGGFIKSITSNIIGVIGNKAIPIVGQIDFVAWMIVLVNEVQKNELIRQVPVILKTMMAGFTGGTWAGYGDQIKSGELDEASAGGLTEQLEGIETSMAFNVVIGAGMVGVGLNEWQKINQVRPLGAISDLEEGRTGQLSKFADENGARMRNITPQWITAKGVAYAWYYTVGTALNYVGDTAVSAVISEACKVIGFFDSLVGLNIYTCSDFESTVDDMTALFMGWFIEFLIGTDPAARGANLGNSIDQGLAVGNETYTKEELGGGRVEGEEAVAARERAAAYAKASFDALPLREKIFSHETNFSVVSQVAMRFPRLSEGNIVSTLASITKLPSVAFSSFAPQASATELEDLYGIWEYDIPDWAFDEIPEEMFTGDPCPDLDPDEKFVSSCRAFLKAIEALEASETGDDGSGFGSGGGGTSTIDGDTQELAQRVLDLVDEGSSITFGATSSCPSSCVREPFERLARGEKANVPAGNTSINETDVHPDILKVIIAAGEEDIPMRITALTTGTHSASSHHYNGTAVDIGNAGDAGKIMPWLFNNRQELNLYDVFHDPTPQYNINDGSPCNCSIGGHGGHIHIGVTP